MNNQLLLVAANVAMVVLVMLVGLRMLYVRIAEMREKRVHPQAAATSLQLAARLERVHASDNFRNLFEVPVLFYALSATALALGSIPQWLVIGAWGFVVLRYLHSLVQCTYNKVPHRLLAFLSSSLLLVGMWIAVLVNLAQAAA